MSSSAAENELPGSQNKGEDTPPPQEPPSASTKGFPPYPPYATERAPPSVATAIHAGRDIRTQFKSGPRQIVRSPPRPARPKGPKVPSMKMSKRALRAHTRCLRRHGAVLTDRMEYISRPLKRSILYLWRERAHTLPAETIARLRTMLDADEPFKPDQAYEYFINLRKTKKKMTNQKINQIKDEVKLMCNEKRFGWARNATVVFASGIQQRLAKPGCFILAEGMLRMSNIILDDICGYMQMKTPSRRSRNPKARLMMEIADKIAVWIDDILKDADDRMLMMDFDEDDDLLRLASAGGDAGFADDFLNMMSGGGLLKGPQPAYLKFSGDMLEAFIILSDAMYTKDKVQLLSHGKFSQTYKEGADELKQATDFEASDFNCTLAKQLNNDLSEIVKANTPSNIVNAMKEIVSICSNYLAQHAEYNKDKGPAFRLLVKTLNTKPGDQLYQQGKAKRTFGAASTELENAKGLESDHDDPNLSQNIHSTLSKLTDKVTPAELKTDMTETLDICSKYLSQRAIDENERGPAFEILIKELEKHGGDNFTLEHVPLANKFSAAYTLKSAPGLTTNNPDPKTAPDFKVKLHRAVDAATPKNLVNDMDEVIDRCGNYLSAFVRDRDKAFKLLVQMMKSNSNKELTSRNNYEMKYGTGAIELENAPVLTPYLPVKDIADEAKKKLTADMEKSTPRELVVPVKCVVQDASKYLSQAVAVRSGAAGERYTLNLLAAVMKSIGSKSLFKFKSFGQTYHDGGEELKYSGPLEVDPKSEDLASEIKTEMHRGVPSRLSPTITKDLSTSIADAAQHLAKTGTEKGEALDHLVTIMKKEGDASLGVLQGYQQTYNDGARRIENSTSLKNDRVDKGAYEGVRGKLKTIAEKTPAPQYEKVMPGIVDDAAKFLSSPFPETDSDKRRVLADLMARKKDDIFHQENMYKITYEEAGEELMNAPVGVTKSHDNAKQKVLREKVHTVIPEKKLQDALRGRWPKYAEQFMTFLLNVTRVLLSFNTSFADLADEGAAYLTDLVKGRGEAMQVIHDGLKKESGKDFLTIGKFSKNHSQAAQMIETAPHFGGQNPSPILLDKVNERIDGLSKIGASPMAEKYMEDTGNLTAKYIAGIATKECGLDATALAKLYSTQDPNSRTTLVIKDNEEIRSTDDDAARRKTDEDERRRLEEERRRREEVERNKKTETMRRGTGVFDPEKEAALQILHRELRSKGNESFYRQPQADLSHTQASEWIGMKPPMKVDKTVKDSGDTDRLHKKFEKKLSGLVIKSTPPNITDAMQDVVIESSRILSENFVSKSYKTLVRDALISEMQKRGNEILIEVNGAAESNFFAAQRLKEAKSYEAKEPCTEVSYRLTKKLEDMIRCRSMARKLTGTMKEHIKEAANYLSENLTKPDEKIEAYAALVGEMEAAGDALLIEGNIPKSFKDSAAYLKQLTSSTDEINKSNSSLQSTIETKLKNLMVSKPPTGYSSSTMNGVISHATSLLVSYIMLQEEKTKALNIMINEMDKAGPALLLRHGVIRKSYGDGADILRGKNTDQLNVINVDPVVSRKINLKLSNLMEKCENKTHQNLMDDLVEDVTGYLAVHLLRPHVAQVCKCMKNVFVQCELWCDEILRRVSRPCCKCSRHISVQALEDLVPAQRLRIPLGANVATAPGTEIHLKTCPSKTAVGTGGRGERSPPRSCTAPKPTIGCQNATTSYLLSSTNYFGTQSQYVNHAKASTSSDSICSSGPPSKGPVSEASILCNQIIAGGLNLAQDKNSSTEDEQIGNHSSSPGSYYTPPSTYTSNLTENSSPYWQTPTILNIPVTETLPDQNETFLRTFRRNVCPQLKREYSSRAPIVSTDQMADWHAMMVSLMWNIQAWKDWIQENIDRGLLLRNDELRWETECWTTFQRKIETEAYQWRQYNIFSRQLTLRLALRYKDKQIVSPTRASEKTQVYLDYQWEMLDIISIFDKWTQWLGVVVKETDMIKLIPEGNTPLNVLRWGHFKKKIEEHADDWKKYNLHLRICWEKKYKVLISEWLPALKEPGPVWVVSACGAVPSGAVAGGVFEGEVTWVARTTHNCNVLPAALHPSKHCCFVYADGAVHQYNKYQVMCNAEATWVAWRAGEVGARAVRVAPGVHVGRVHYRGSHLLGPVHAPHYRCHVVIFGRPFAFNCYELLVLMDVVQ